MKRNSTKTITTAGMLAAVAYLLMLICHLRLVPSADFLTYDPKDAIIVIAAFITGPVSGVLITIVVGLLEMVTISSTGPIGLLMNVVSTLSFVLPASIIYKKKKSIRSAIIGLAIGMLCVTASMLLWNYLITPLYQGVPREAVAAMLLPVFLPFNLIKAGINTAITLIIYKPLVKVLRKAGLVEQSEAPVHTEKKHIGTWLVGLFLLLVCILVILTMYIH